MTVGISNELLKLNNFRDRTVETQALHLFSPLSRSGCCRVPTLTNSLPEWRSWMDYLFIYSTL